MKEAVEQITVFYSEDGKRFLQKEVCEVYEKEQKAKAHRLLRTKFFEVIHSPDLTEGRGWYGRLFMAVEDDYADSGQETFALAALVSAFGNPLAFVQGCAPMPNWRLSAIQCCVFEAWEEKSISVGDYSYPASALFISNKGPVNGWPPPLPVASLLDKKKVTDCIVGSRKK